MHKKEFFPLYCVHISRFHSAVTSNPKSFSPAATLEPRARNWTRDRDFGPATRDFGPTAATWTRDLRLLVKLNTEFDKKTQMFATSLRLIKQNVQII